MDISNKVEQFFAAYPVRKYKKGQILILKGDAPQTIHYLLKGTVKQYDIDYRGEEIVLNLFKPGAFFPMSFALNGGVSDFIFEADSDIELQPCPAAEAVKFVRDNPDVLLDLLARVYRGMDSLLGRITQLTGGSAKSRLIFELTVTAKRFGQPDGRGGYRLDISEKDLAARAGLSRETVSREMQKLKGLGLAEYDAGHIMIADLPALEASLE